MEEFLQPSDGDDDSVEARRMYTKDYTYFKIITDRLDYSVYDGEVMLIAVIDIDNFNGFPSCIFSI